MKPITLFSFLALLIALAQGCSRTYDGFKLPVQDSVQALLFANEATMPEEIIEAVEKDSGAVVLVDIRTPVEFAEGHLLNAVNIPAQHVLDPAAKKRWKDEKTVFYLYGATQLEANGPWMVLSQLGYTNIRVLQGGLAYFADFADSSFLKLEDETARYNYAEIFSKNTEEIQKAKAPAPKPGVAEKPKTIVPEKKAKPEPAAVEEQEGC